jgi:hypothetical protein
MTARERATTASTGPEQEQAVSTVALLAAMELTAG